MSKYYKWYSIYLWYINNILKSYHGFFTMEIKKKCLVFLIFPKLGDDSNTKWWKKLT